jgi:hypothetical protein
MFRNVRSQNLAMVAEMEIVPEGGSKPARTPGKAVHRAVFQRRMSELRRSPAQSSKAWDQSTAPQEGVPQWKL